MGHFNRALALARSAARRGIRTTIVTNCRYAGVVLTSGCRRLVSMDEKIEIVEVPHDSKTSNTQAAELAAFVTAVLQKVPYDLLVVDNFPRGLVGDLVSILPTVACPKVLVHRDLDPRYVAWANLPEFVEQHYDLVVSAGDDAPEKPSPLIGMPQSRQTAPWLVCGADEWLTRPLARWELGIDEADTRPVAVVLGCGKADECLAAAHAAVELAKRVASHAHVRFLSCDVAALEIAGPLGRCLWPAVVVLPGVDLLLGAGGYNTVYEARATSTPLLAVAQERLYDRQSLRLRAHERCADWSQLVVHAADSLMQDGLQPRSPVGQAENGAAVACPWLETLAASILSIGAASL